MNQLLQKLFDSKKKYSASKGKGTKTPTRINLDYPLYCYCLAGNRSTSSCAPGWYKTGNACFLFYFQYAARWSEARSFCHKQGADLAVVNDAVTIKQLTNQRREMKLDDRELFIGLSGQLNWIWSDGTNFSRKNSLWGPGEPSGDGKCGSFLNAISWDSAWQGYGWRWNDEKCINRKGFICEEPLGRINGNVLA